MRRSFLATGLSIIAASGIQTAGKAVDDNLAISTPVTKPAASGQSATPPATSPATIPVVTQAVPAAPAQPATSAGTGNAGESAPRVPSPSAVLNSAYVIYRNNPNPNTFAEFLRLFKLFLGGSGVGKLPATAIIQANPALADLGTRVIDAGAGRIWTFPRVQHSRDIIVQWNDTKSTITLVGRRQRKHVTTTSVQRIQTLTVPGTAQLKEARIVSNGDGRLLILTGDDGSALWLQAFKAVDGLWTHTTGLFTSLPGFLTNNVSGKVAFRGNDMIINVGRVVPPGDHNTRLPEAESSTYRFLLKLTESGYVLQKHIPDSTQFAVVRQFLEALAGNRTDQARSLLTDAKLLNIPRYVGISGPSANFRVVQMASPPSGAPRYRLITEQKNDLIFEVAKVKDRLQIRALFIAPADPFLPEISKILPTYDQVQVAPPAPTTPEITATHSLPKH